MRKLGKPTVVRDRLFPKKTWARKHVERALAAGRLVREACEVCGNARTNGHHDDYDRPLSVRWLCHLHHRAWHDANGQGLHWDTPIPVVLLSSTDHFRGIYWEPARMRWRAELIVAGRRVLRRRFKTDVDAARAYDAAARQHLGPAAKLNFPLEAA